MCRVIVRGLLRGLAACPGLVALFALAVFGALAGVGLWQVPARLERGFDLLAESDVDSAIRQGAFAASVAENAQVGERRNGSATNAYRIFDVFVTYELKDQQLKDGILNPRALTEIADFERSLRALPAWRAMCAMAEEPDRPLCEPGLSLASYALATRDVGRGEFVPRSLSLDGRGQDALPPLAALHMVQRHKLDGLLLPKAAGASGSSLGTLRSAFRFKLPCGVAGGQQAAAAVEQLQTAWDELLEESLLPTLQASRAAEDRKLLRVDFHGMGLRAAEYARVLLMDAALAAGAAAFSFVYLVWHTRSVLLSVVAVGLSLLALPLVHFLLAASVSGPLEAGALFLVAAFCAMGIGVDAALVYTDHWWDSAQCEATAVDRLARTYRLAGQTTLAASASTALSFLAMLASVVRQLREFGLFTAISVMVAWLLISLIYVPLCILGDRHCAACRLHTASTKVVSSSTDGEKPDAPVQEEGRASSQAFAALLPRLRYLRCPACLLPVLAAVASCYVALWQAKLSTASFEPLPEGHVARRGERVVEGFPEASQVFGTGFAPPALAEEVCSERVFRSDDPRRCGLFWCEAAPLQHHVANGSCACQRHERTGCGAAAHVDAVQRFVGLPSAPAADLVAAAGAFLAADAAAAGLSLRSSGGLLGGATSSPLAPLVLQEFQSGESALAPVTEVATPLTRRDPMSSSCGWDDVCFCGARACRLPARAWREVPRAFAQPQYSATPAPQQPHPPPRPRALVHVAFGLKVHRASALPLLGKLNWASSWSFSESFDARQPAAQIDLRAICSGLPRELGVAERRCWTDDFESFLAARSERFPVPAARFDALLADFLSSGRTGAGSSDEHFWLRGGRLRACSVSFALEVPRTARGPEVAQLQKAWDSYLEAFNGVASVYTLGAFHTSELWAEAEAEGALLSSMGLVAGVALILTLVSTRIFTQSFLLPVFVATAAVGSVSGMAFFAVVVLRWTIGPIEVIALAAFAGYSIHGALHVACAYSCNEALAEAAPQRPPAPGLDDLDSFSATRLRRTGYALKSVGGAVVGGSMATAASSAFLALSQLTFLRKLGAVVPVLVLVSTFNALLPLPAGSPSTPSPKT